MPENLGSLRAYSASNPHKKFISKNNLHSSIKMVRPEEFSEVPGNSIVQELIENPLLIKGHKFDITLPVIITSIEPLR